MVLKVAFQMDPIENVRIEEDTTFRLAEEAYKRGHELFYYTPEDLAFEEGRIICNGNSLDVRREQNNHFTLGANQILDLSKDVDIIWLRQDPPFNMSYITTTHFLDRVREHSLVVNDPFWVRNFPEKLLVLDFPDLIPPTIISKKLTSVKRFRDMHGDIVVKPLYGNGGSGIFQIKRNDPNLSSLLEVFENLSGEPIIAQKYIPEVINGDKRVILVDGNPIGAINRVPAFGEIRSNMHVGGKPEKATLTARDMEVCSRVGPVMSERGQILVGLDIIGDKLTEINLTSPTGIQEIEKFDNLNVAGIVWEAVEKTYKSQFG